MINANSIKSILASNDRAVERAIVVLVLRQTTSEVGQGATTESNGRGFSAFSTYLAKWILNLRSNATAQEVERAAFLFLASTAPGRPLSGRFLDKGRKIATFHHKQILEVALAKQAALAEAEEAAEREAIQAVG